MRQELEAAVGGQRFNMGRLVADVWPLVEAEPQIRQSIAGLEAALAHRYARLKDVILRHVFLIELVSLPAVNTTRFHVRWSAQLQNDPRYCSFDECLIIASDLLNNLEEWLRVAPNQELIEICFDRGLIAYDAPLDYRQRPIGQGAARIHQRDNLAWVSNETMLHALQLRKFLTSPLTSPDSAFFRTVLKDKIAIKSYLTDRVQTGEYQTNREKRWEVHPNSVHFAFRRDCLAIEYKLVRQLCGLQGFPVHVQETLQNAGILPAEMQVFRCPITLDPMSYEAFHDQLTNRVAGRSDFQVGHLNPLKLNDPNANAAGHTPENISWVSADGNRIQGSLGLVELRALLRRIAANYEAAGWVH